MMLFDESVSTLIRRTAGLNIDLQPFIESGAVIVKQIDSAELSPGEMVHFIREAVDKEHVSIGVIDSRKGYRNAMPGEQLLISQLHELLSFLGQRVKSTLMACAHHCLIGNNISATMDRSEENKT